MRKRYGKSERSLYEIIQVVQNWYLLPNSAYLHLAENMLTCQIHLPAPQFEVIAIDGVNFNNSSEKINSNNITKSAHLYLEKAGHGTGLRGNS